MAKNPYQPDLRTFLQFVENELAYLEEGELSYDHARLKAAAALVILKEYLETTIAE